jgi:cytochrome c-type biogenesis protein
MEFLTAGLLTALWLGILTSISPCPMATNIAAISFIGKKVGSTRAVLLSGLFYTLGRMIAYLAVAMIVVYSLLSVPELARFLQKYLNIILGPLLIIVGLFLLEIIKMNFGKGMSFSQKFQDSAQKKGIWGAAMLGFIFALSFCPVSAGLFFGSLIPLSLKYESALFLPLIYGIGTALPVIIFAIVIGYSANYIGKIFNRLTKFEYWARRVTGVIFIIAGLYLTWEFIL